MQSKIRYKKIYRGIMGLLWIAGLMIAGSDNLYMPWINGFGLTVFLLASVMIAKSGQEDILNIDGWYDSMFNKLNTFHKVNRLKKFETKVGGLGTLTISRTGNAYKTV